MTPPPIYPGWTSLKPTLFIPRETSSIAPASRSAT
jgi:hypothetical protein